MPVCWRNGTACGQHLQLADSVPSLPQTQLVTGPSAFLTHTQRVHNQVVQLFLLRPKWAEIFDTSALGHHYQFIRTDKKVYLSSWAGLSSQYVLQRVVSQTPFSVCFFKRIFLGKDFRASIHERVAVRNALATGPLNTGPSIFLSRAFNKGEQQIVQRPPLWQGPGASVQCC